MDFELHRSTSLTHGHGIQGTQAELEGSEETVS